MVDGMVDNSVIYRFMSDRRVYQAVMNLKRRYKSTRLHAVSEDTIALEIDMDDIAMEIRSGVKTASDVYYRESSEGGYIIVEFTGSGSSRDISEDPRVRVGLSRLRSMGYDVKLLTEDGKGYVVLNADDLGKNIAKEIRFFRKKYAVKEGRLVITLSKGGGQ
jgi:hypothetical protein